MNFTDCGIFGFDVSRWQDVNATPQKIDFVKMKEYGASFVVIKVGQLALPDEDFADNWLNAKTAGIPRSAYWFCDKNASGKAQASKFWNLVRNDQPEGMLYADYENGSWTDWNQLYAFLYELQQLSGYPSSRIGIYTGYYYWAGHSPTNSLSLSWFSKFPLWLAWYSENPAYVKIPKPWTECLLWQSGTPAIGLEVGAESREIDYNKFNGDAEKFKQFMGGEAVPPDNGGEVTVLYYADLKSGATSNVRQGPGLTYAYAAGSPIAGPVTVSIISEKVQADGYDWYLINSPVAGYIALTTSYMNFRPASSQPSEDYPVKVTVQMSSGKVYESTNLVLK